MIYLPYSTPSFEMSDMLGKVFVSVVNKSDEVLRFTEQSGDEFLFHHFQECCESVMIEEIIGDLSDLVGSPLLEASVESNSEDGRGDSTTWTFYKFGTIKGHVTVRWCGNSNGYYSEAVDQSLIKKVKA